MDQIRTYVGKPTIHSLLAQNKTSWNQLCSSTDVIEDTELAIESYLNREFQEKTGAHYLAVYGLLQAMFLQQDATSHLSEALSFGRIDFRRFPQLQEIRDRRNDAIGHPTKRGSGQISHHYISRETLTHAGFQLISFYPDGSRHFIDVPVLKHIAAQHKEMRSILQGIIDKLKEEDSAQKEAFMAQKLEYILCQHTHWQFQQIYKGIFQPQDFPPQSALTALQSIRQTVNSFQEELEKRGIDREKDSSINEDFERTEYPLSKLEAYLKSSVSGQAPNVDTRDIRIFWENAQYYFDRLVGLAVEIDKEYAQLP